MRSKVLVLEPQRLQREMLLASLSLGSHEVHSTSSHEEALEVLRGFEIELVIINCGADGGDHRQFFEECARLKINPIWLGLIGPVDPKPEILAPGISILAWILTPIDPPALINTLHRLLRH